MARRGEPEVRQLPKPLVKLIIWAACCVGQILLWTESRTLRAAKRERSPIESASIEKGVVVPLLK